MLRKERKKNGKTENDIMLKKEREKIKTPEDFRNTGERSFFPLFFFFSKKRKKGENILLSSREP